MVSPIAVVTLDWDGHDIQDVDGLHLVMVAGGPDEVALVRGRDDIIPGRAGRSGRNRKEDRRTIELGGPESFVTGVGSTLDDMLADYWTNRLLIGSWFSPSASAKTLTATLPTGAVYTISARPQAPILIVEEFPGKAKVSITLESIAPDWELAP